MDILQFRIKVFNNRGQMKNISRANNWLVSIINTPLEAQALEHKRIGLQRLSEICKTYSIQEQHQFAAWLSENKQAKKKEIELFITSLGEIND